jgi:hypothetical protein
MYYFRPVYLNLYHRNRSTDVPRFVFASLPMVRARALVFGFDHSIVGKAIVCCLQFCYAVGLDILVTNKLTVFYFTHNGR